MNRQDTRRSWEGTVISDNMDKTVVVEVGRLVAHPLYGKVLRKTQKFKAHDENNQCHVGDRVRMVKCRPLSKEKTWRVVQILSRAQ